MTHARKIGMPVLLATLSAIATLAFLSLGCSKKTVAPGSASPALPADFPSGKPCFVRVPPPADWSWLSKPPRSFDKARKWGPLYELRHADLSRLDLTDHASDLLNSFFDTETKWPAANFHGTLVTSILAGRTCGVAPEAEIYYVGSHNYDVSSKDDSMVPNAAHCARAVNELLEINARLPREKKIRVISITAGWSPANPGFRAMNKAVRKATEAGIFIVSANLFDAFETGFWFWGLDRSSPDGPDDPAAYRILPWKEWISEVVVEEFPKFYERRLQRSKSAEFLLVPVGSKTVAQAGGRNEYGFYRMGGWSSLCPYIAGLYALACQVKPDITPEVFWRAAMATGAPMPVKTEWATYAGKRVNPVRLIESLK